MSCSTTDSRSGDERSTALPLLCEQRAALDCSHPQSAAALHEVHKLERDRAERLSPTPGDTCTPQCEQRHLVHRERGALIVPDG